MAPTTIVFGILLVLLGVVPYLMTRQMTALIPAFVFSELKLQVAKS